MATITVSAAGGNWSSGATWVGGVLPAVGDDIVAALTSGPLVVDGDRTCLTITFTNYINTFTINNGVILTVTGTAITLGSGMTFASGTTGLLNTVGVSGVQSTSITITFAGITIPNLRIGRYLSGGQTVTISGTTPTVTNFTCSGVTAITLSGTALTITDSITGNQTLNGPAFTFLGTVTLSQTGGNITNGFTVPAGSTLIIGSNITGVSGNITFAVGSFLIPGTFTFTITSTCTLDSSVVTWYNLHTTSTSHAITLSSDLNISNNLTWAIISLGIQITSPTIKTITVQGSVTSTAGYGRPFNLNNIILNLTGKGNFAVASILTSVGFTCAININTSDPIGYVIGSSTFTGINTMQLSALTFTLVGTSVASAYNGTTLLLNGVTLDTNRSSVGGSDVVYTSIQINFGATFTTDTTCSGNLVFTSSISGSSANGAKVLFGGNLIGSPTFTVIGTSILEFIGSNPATWVNGAYQNNIVVNKSGGAVVTTGTTISWGTTGRTLTLNTAVNFTTNSTTFTLVGTPLTINNSFGNSFFNLTTPASTVNINGATTPITNDLRLSGLGATFTGSFGWTCKNLICSTAGTFNITLQELVTYRTTSAVSITGGLATTARPTMTSSGASNAIWTLDFGATQSLIYVNGTRIDSSGGQTIWSFGVSPANIATTINWNPGVPLRTVAYTFVN